jgi:anti-sigma factor RsiW
MTVTDHPSELEILARAHGELSADRAAAVDDHCRGCAGCRQTLAELGRLHMWLGADRDASEVAPVWPALAAELERTNRRNLGPALALGMAAACAAGVVVGLFVGAPPDKQMVAETETSWSELWPGRPGESLLDLFSDGSTVSGKDAS